MGNPYAVSLMFGPGHLPRMPAMPGKKFKLKPQEDAAVSHARRKETVRGALKLFRVLLDAAKRHAEWAEDRHGLAGAQLWALWELRQTPGMRAVDLARSMAIHRQTAETLLSELVGLGLVRMVATDAQTALYCLTSEGRSIAESVPECGQGVLMAALEQLPDASLEQVVVALRSVAECLPFREDRAALKPLSDILRPLGEPHPDPMVR